MTIVRWFPCSRLSRTYLAVVVLVTAASLWELLPWVQPDANLAPIWPLPLTMPLSLPFVVWAPDELTSPWFFTLCVSVSALANAAILNRIMAWCTNHDRASAPTTGHALSDSDGDRA